MIINNHEKNLLLTAVMFYTRIPIPKDTPYSAELLAQSRKYFTVIGLLIGTIACLSFLVLSTMLPVSLAVMISMIISILATGAFHEDGFADTCDALGGGWSQDQVLKIMKDSRLGTYGSIGLVGILAIKYSVLVHIAEMGLMLFCCCVISAHTVSRLLASRMIGRNQYVQDIDLSKVKPMADAELTATDENVVIWVGLAPCLFLIFQSVTATLFALILSFVVTQQFMSYCNRRIGGYTGDILGAIQQLGEVFFLLACLIAVTV